MDALKLYKPFLSTDDKPFSYILTLITAYIYILQYTSDIVLYNTCTDAIHQTSLIDHSDNSYL